MYGSGRTHDVTGTLRTATGWLYEGKIGSSMVSRRFSQDSPGECSPLNADIDMAASESHPSFCVQPVPPPASEERWEGSEIHAHAWGY
jgi:hypothetical protein